MTTEIFLTLLILAVAVALFASGKFEFDHIVLGVLVALYFGRLVTVDDLFRGFSNRAVITIASVYVISAGVARTGVAYAVGQQIGRLAGNSEAALIALTMVGAGVLSAFMNNIGAAAVMLPTIVAAARSLNIPVSRVLLPLSYGALMGGMLTLVGTPSNLLVNGVMIANGYESFGLFEFTPFGVAVLGAGIVVMVSFRKWILPSHPAGAAVDEMMPQVSTGHEPYRLRERLSELVVPNGCALDGRTILDVGMGHNYGIWVQVVIRGERRITSPDVHTAITGGDRLIVSAREEDVLRFAEDLGVDVDNDRHPRSADFFTEDLEVAEIAVMPRSENIGKTLPEIKFHDSYGVTVLGIWRDGRPHRTHLAEMPLQQGDALLVQGQPLRLRELREGGQDFTVVTDDKGVHFRKKKAPLAVAVLLFYVVGMAIGLAPVAVVALAGAGAMVTVGAITMVEARRAIDARSIILVGGMLAMAEAMKTSNAAGYLAQSIVDATGAAGDAVVLAAILLLSAAFAILINNHVTAVLMTPLALQAALAMGAGVDPRMFAMAVALGAGSGFASPFSHPANILVMGPGNYKFGDYLRAGMPLLVVVLIVSFVMLLVVFR
jgi:di/tricarboxylate transporter